MKVNGIWGSSYSNAEAKMKAFIKEHYSGWNIDSIKVFHHSDCDLLAYEAQAEISIGE